MFELKTLLNEAAIAAGDGALFELPGLQAVEILEELIQLRERRPEPQQVLHLLDHRGSRFQILVVALSNHDAGGDTLISWLNAPGAAISMVLTRGQGVDFGYVIPKLGGLVKKYPVGCSFFAHWVTCKKWFEVPQPDAARQEVRHV